LTPLQEKNKEMNGKHIQTRHDGDSGSLTITVSGVFNFDLIADFRSAYDQLEPVPQHVTVDLRATEAIDSAALGMLLNMQEKLGLGREAVHIINASRDVRRILEITHFDKKFTID
jgi:anti-anti-sigma factor